MTFSTWKILGSSNREDCLIDLLSKLREEGSIEDELLLLSGGPLTDLSRRSLLPSIDSIRILTVSYTHLTLPTILLV